MAYSIHIDWSEERQNYNNIGRDILRASCKHKDGVAEKDYCEKCEISEDSAEPMMNYIYPLECSNFEDKDILRVVKETNCTIVEKDGEYFLSLCGGGMDLSQDIALSYLILENWIPQDLLNEVCKQPLFSLGSKNYKFLAREIIKQFKSNAKNFQQKAKDWRESLKTLQQQEKAKKQEASKQTA